LQSHDRANTTSPASASDKPATKKVSMSQLEELFKNLGVQYSKQVEKKAAYIASLKPRLINCSFGAPNLNLLQSMKQNMVQQWGWTNPTETEVQAVVSLLCKHAFLPRDKVFFGSVPNALIFFAAGNSSENNDGFVTSPSHVDLSNKIVIAATMENKKIADFSCFGKKTVDVAVPGVNIYASYPAEKMGYMSGTSMACPMAVKFASMVLKKNEKLTPQELKKILMQTVDKKAWLKDKVVAGGVINVNRAMYASKLMADGKSITAAIKASKTKVADMIDRTPNKFKGPDLSNKEMRDMYFSAVF